MKNSITSILLIIFLLSSTASAFAPVVGTFVPIASYNFAPVQSNHLIWNGLTEKTLNATNVNVSSVSINFTIADPNGNVMDWYIYLNTGGIYNLIDSDSSVSNGTVTTTNISWFRQTTNYSISFNLTDGIDWSNKSYWFITDFSVPQISSPSPSNGSIIAVSTCNWNVAITDFVPFNWSIECTNGQNSSGNMDTNGTFYLNLTSLTTLTLYTVYVNVTNGNMTNNVSYIFTVIISAPSSTGRTGGGGGLYILPPSEELIKKGAPVEEAGINISMGIIILVVLFIIFIILFLRKRKKEAKV